MTLFEIDKAYMECLEHTVDTETGEILDESLLDRLAELDMARDQKLDNTASYIKELRAEADAIRAERQALDQRMKSKEALADRLEGYLDSILGGSKFESARNRVSYRKSVSVSVPDVELLPEVFIRTKVTREADKTAIKDALKAGTEVPGAELVEKYNIQIK